jgi:uncharacterized membrane-anchored protein YjiN (DUF445 family)
MTTIPIPQVHDPALKRARLVRMKRVATGLLLAVTAVFVAARLLEARYPWLAVVRATAEAAMVGALADWFAVTALFRRPLGLPIPHTAIVPTRKDQIGRSLGNFVQNNFLSREVIAVKLGELGVARRIAQWISKPENARKVSAHTARALSGAVQVLRDEDVQELIDRSVVARVRATRVAPVVGNVLSVITAENRHQELLDEALRLLDRAVDQNEDVIRDRIREESPWWLPERVDDKIHDKIVAAIENTLHAVSLDPTHPLRRRFDDAVHRFVDRLRNSPEVIAKGEELKEELLAHPAVRQFSAAVWADAKRAVLRYAERHGAAAGALPALPPGSAAESQASDPSDIARSDGAAPDDPRGAPLDAAGAASADGGDLRPVERGIVSFGQAMLDDAELLAKVDGWILDATLYVVEQYRTEVGQFIAETVRGWDPDETTKKIELAVGRDLQFIRINGTIMGGLVGLLLYVLSRWM